MALRAERRHRERVQRALEGKPLEPRQQLPSGTPAVRRWDVPFVHGAKSTFVIDGMAEGILDWLTTEASRTGSPIAFVLEPAFAPTLYKWARAEAKRMRFEA